MPDRTLGPEDGEFLATYEKYVREVIAPAELLVRRIFDEWKVDGYWARHRPHNQRSVALPRPMQRPRTRIKRPESVLDKIERLPKDFPSGASLASLRKMQDLLGARVVTFFPAHMKMVDLEIRSGRHFEVARRTLPRSYLALETMHRIGLDPRQFKMKGVKRSGYASLHYVVRRVDGVRPNPWFELQVRTMLEEVWGEVEHQLAYKPEKQTEFSVVRQFRVISHYLSAVDDHFDYLYDRLQYFQARADPKADDPLNAENFPRVLENIECLIEQDEIDPLLRILDARGITKVREFNIRAMPAVIEEIRERHAAANPQVGTPTAFFIVATLALLPERPTSRDIKEAVAFNLAAQEMTHRLRAEEPADPAQGPDNGAPGS